MEDYTISGKSCLSVGRLAGHINRLGLFLHSIKLFLKSELVISLEEELLSGALFIM